MWRALAHGYLEVQQDEMRGQREQMETQNKFLVKQAVQNQFFQMLESWQDVIEQVMFQDRQGRGAFTLLADRLLRELSPIIRDGEGNLIGAAERKQLILHVYGKLKRDREAQIGHYFRLLYHTIRIVDMSHSLNDDEKKDFVRILRAHVSEPEFALLFYNCIHPDGEKLHPLVEKYDLLQNMSERNVA